ncbi:DUF3905 domain-containing protein [Bacillus shivajii]|nr:DUF3905 domain-containing protein [Bacillus shivajii]
MKQKRSYNPNPETPLDHWDDTIDPAIMSGDHWVEEEEAPLIEDEQASRKKIEKETMIKDMFTHPVHQTGEKTWVASTKSAE